MDFSKNAFQSTSFSTLSPDTMDHAKMVMACRFGWNAGPENTLQTHATPHAPSVQAPLTSSSSYPSNKRFTPCRGRLYHQLNCSHRIRTDVVEDCGSNCLDPLNNASRLPFYCHECVEQQASKIWNEREAQHNAAHPPMNQMTKEQYEQWYDEHRHLEAQFSKDRKVYELELKASTRPSNVCSAIEMSKEERDFAAKLDSLSLAMVSSNDAPVGQAQSHTNRTSLPNDASEQLHWHLNALALDRGSCGVEYSVNSPTNSSSRPSAMDEDELWRQARR